MQNATLNILKVVVKKCSMIYILHSENFYIFSKMQNATLNILKVVAKTCEKALRLNINSTIQI